MPHAHSQVTINRPIDEVFAYVSDPRNESHWLPGASQISNVSDGPTHVGTTYDSVAHFLGRRMDFKVEVIDCTAPTDYGYRATHGPLVSYRRIHLEPADGDGTHVSMHLEAEGHRTILKMAEDLMIRAGQRHDQHGLENLRDILETHGPEHPRHDV
jgi:carbon monoxide dehydrogenase subunit G